MKRSICIAYGAACYLVAMATMAYAALYFGNILVPVTIDAFGATPLPEALLINALLIVGFGVQHSGMARPGAKRVMARIVSDTLVRSTYVLISSLSVVVLMVCWQPIGIVVWHIESPLPRVALAGGYLAGWALIVRATFLIDHLEMFGLRQVLGHRRDQAPVEPGFCTPGAYRLVRHPVHLGWMIVLWMTPTMTLTHLLLSVGMTGYIVVGARLEEKSLVAQFPDYRQYARKVPMFIPSLRKRLDV